MSTPWNYAASAKAIVNVGNGAEMVDEFGPLTRAGIDTAFKGEAATPVQGAAYYKTKNVDKNNYSYQGVNGIGQVQLNSDGDDIPTDKKSLGFSHLISNYTMRLKIGITREMTETDRYGVIGDHSRSLVHSARKTTERIFADTVNRGFGTTGLSILCEDGLGMFSAGRPQPKADAGTWSNLEATGDLTADSITTARLNFRQYKDRSGDLDPQMLQKVIVSTDLEDTIKEITGTTLKVDSSLNNVSVVSDVSYEVWDWLSPKKVIYQGNGENELEFHTRVNPNVVTFQAGDNPDLIWSRLRMAIGTGCRRPLNYRGQQTP